MNGNTEKKWTLRAGCMGISCNLLLFALKFFLGHLSRSVSIQADATNNLSDALTSALSLFAALYARKEADEEHPFGHGRMEYIMTMILSMLILILTGSYQLVGTTFTPYAFGFVLLFRLESAKTE